LNILIATHDLINEKCHLMPWRTVCEITQHLQAKGHEVRLVSLGEKKEKVRSTKFSFDILEIRKSPNHLQDDLRTIFYDTPPDAIFWPVGWREPIKRIRIIGHFGIPILGYFPGGCYSLQSVLYAIRHVGFRAILPYLFESICQQVRPLNFLKKNGFRCLISMTKMTSERAIASGWSKNQIFTIPPGRNNRSIDMETRSLPASILEWLKKSPFYLFMGPPSKIRGVFEMLEAFDKAAARIQDICLVCLFRPDDVLDSGHIRKRIRSLKYHNRVFANWESLEKEELNAFVKSCHAVIMPFLLVPSEIPLSIIETMAWGKPVITTTSSGTGNFVSPFGIVTRPGSIDLLAKAFVDLIEDPNLYRDKCKVAVKGYSLHPTWEEISLSWLNAAKSAINAPH